MDYIFVKRGSCKFSRPIFNKETVLHFTICNRTAEKETLYISWSAMYVKQETLLHTEKLPCNKTGKETRIIVCILKILVSDTASSAL